MADLLDGVLLETRRIQGSFSLISRNQSVFCVPDPGKVTEPD